MIKSFADKEAEKVWKRLRSKALPQQHQRSALRKLSQIHFAGELSDLRLSPGNRLEKLAGDRAGQHSIRINDQYRICFTWEEGNAYEVEIVDYHR
jgi:proteic killer suppression protein